MDEREFSARAGEALHRLEAALRDLEGLEADLAGDILTVEFDDGEKFVINSHTAARQIWAAASLSAMHFGWHEATSSWRDTKSGAELFTEVGKLVGDKLGLTVKLRT
jgi:CyaY protein